MLQSEHFNLNLVQGNDIVNPLVQEVPNFEKIDNQMFKNQNAGVQNATELKSGTVHAITRLVPDSPFITFTATSDFESGDTFTVDGVQVSALNMNGETLPSRAYVINAQVFCILKGTLLTFYGTGSEVADNSLALNGHPDTYFGTADDVQNAIDTANAAKTLSETVVKNTQKEIVYTNNNPLGLSENGTIVTVPNMNDYIYFDVYSYYALDNKESVIYTRLLRGKYADASAIQLNSDTGFLIAYNRRLGADNSNNRIFANTNGKRYFSHLNTGNVTQNNNYVVPFLILGTKQW